MAQVVALYRFPVKGFTQETCEELTIQDDGRVSGDRAFAFRYANALAPRERDGMEIWSKSKGLTRMEYPALAALKLSTDASGERIRIDGPDGLHVDEPLSDDGRERVSAAVTEYLLDSADARGLEAPGRLPLSLLGDADRSRFQDSARGFVSMHSRESLRALESALARPIDDHRFRSNIAIEGVEPWEEISELSRVRIGDLEFAPQEVIGRCLNTHANPETGVRDAEVLTTLTRVIGQAQPTFGRFLLPLHGGGTIRVGDTVELIA
ncbi:MOSC domain-containing protein [Leucobacter iarius]|uniref:MOSC domain-containing protein n=1 Tax=Leucobacter iarius TaxID=333963 RepID=A0ABP4XPM5_9MICO